MQSVSSTLAGAALPSNHALAGARVLLVDDNEINRAVVLALLEPLGVQVALAGDGMQALDHLQRARFDLVLMDCQMPVMDGIETTRAIRERPELAQMPIVSMTALGSGDRERSLAAGMDDYIVKPIDPDVLVRTLRSWIYPKTPASPLEELPGVDVASGRRQTLGNDALYTRLLIKFRDTNQDTVETLRAAIAHGEITDARRISHTLQGTAQTLGLKRIAGPAVALDRILREGAPLVPPEADLAELERELVALLNALKRLPAG